MTKSPPLYWRHFFCSLDIEYNFITMLTSLFPTKVFDLYTDNSDLLERYIQVENGTLTLDVPGFSKNDLTLEVDQSEGLITINGEKEINGRKRTVKKSIKDYRLRNIDLDGVEAKIEDGVLSIYLKDLDKTVREKKRQISLK